MRKFIDEFHLAIHPVALGAGLPIFKGFDVPLYFKLADVKVFPGGVVAMDYRNTKPTAWYNAA